MLLNDVLLVPNGHIAVLGSESVMGAPKPNQTERIATLETYIRVIGATLVVLVPCLLWWVWTVSTSLTAIKQQLQDGGNKALVAQLRSPQASAKQFQAALSTVIAQAQTARANATPPNLTKVVNLSSALADVIDQRAEVPEVWQAASQLIDLRSPSAPNQPSENCYTKLPDERHPYPGALPGQKWGVFQRMTDCSVDLDDVTSFKTGLFYKEMLETEAKHPGDNFVPPFLTFVNAHVVYRGGPLPNFSSMIFENCTFDFDIPSIPPALGRSVTTKLLVASDLRRVEVKG